MVTSKQRLVIKYGNNILGTDLGKDNKMSKMKVKPTRTMVECLKKVLTGCQVDLVNLTPQEFRYFVDYNDYNHEVDYDWKTSLFKVIRMKTMLAINT